MIVVLRVPGRFAGAKRGSRVSKVALNPRCERVRAAEHAPRDAFNLLERIHGQAEIAERGAVALSASVARPTLCMGLKWISHLASNGVDAGKKPSP